MKTNVRGLVISFLLTVSVTNSNDSNCLVAVIVTSKFNWGLPTVWGKSSDDNTTMYISEKELL